MNLVHMEKDYKKKDQVLLKSSLQRRGIITVPYSSPTRSHQSHLALTPEEKNKGQLRENRFSITVRSTNRKLGFSDGWNNRDFSI